METGATDGQPAAEEPELPTPTEATAPAGTPLLSATDLVKWYGDTPALRGLSLTVSAGDTVALLGPSGSGKTALLHCLTGLTVPDAGAVRYRDEPVHTMAPPARARLRRAAFGVLTPDAGLLAELSAEENVALPLLLGGASAGEAIETAGKWLTWLDAAECAPLRPGRLSSGQRQRVAAARSLVTGPQILFADEPTAALDSQESAQLLRILLSATRTHSIALLLATHDPQVAGLADRQLSILDGRLLAESAR